jgi:glucosamine-6-phosphate deaminase
MEVIIQPDRQQAARLVARLTARAIGEKPNLVLGLATGRTMELVYQLLVSLCQESQADLSGVRTFNLDEYVGLAPAHPHSYHHYMRQHLFRHVNIDPKNIHLPNGAAADLEKECARYEERIRECGGIDLQLLGLGRAGHIGFNEPLSALRSRTRVKSLTSTTIEQNQPLFGKDPMPRRAITVGIGTILDSRRCVMAVTGREKAEILAKAVEGPITSMISATALQLHPRCIVIADEEAASLLTQQEYYRWVFSTEPEWEQYR